MRPSSIRHLLASLLLLAACAGAAEPDKAFHLYLLIGQSNMTGRGAVDAASKPEQPRILALDRAQQWVQAKDPLHFDKPAAGVGPGLAFAQRLLAAEKDPAVRIGLIPCAVGGTSISVWKPGALDPATKTHPYDDMLVRLRAAQTAGVLHGVIWHQGESDRSHPDGYAADLAALIARVRTEAGAPEVPVVAGEVASFQPGNAAQTAALNQQLRSLEGTVARFAVIAADGTVDKGDKLHFDSASARLMGQRFADRLLQLNAGSAR